MKRIKLDIQKFGGTYNVRAQVVSQDVTNNKSTIRITATSTTNGATHNTTGDAYIQGSYSGGASGSLGRQYIYVDYDSSASVSWDIPVQHNNDGTCGAINISCYHYITDATNGNSSTSITPPTIPRYTSVSYINLDSANSTETSLRLYWKTAHNCKAIKYGLNTSSATTISNLNASSGWFTITGLQANTPYTIYFQPCRYDSGLWGNGSANAWYSESGIKTWNYPTLGGGSNFTIGDTNKPLIQMNNPMGRDLTVNILTETGTPVKTIEHAKNTFTLTFTNEENNIFYNSIPNKKSGIYKVQTISSVNSNTVNAREYSVNENNCRPVFNDFAYEDVDSTTLALTGNNQILVKGYSDVRAIVSTANKATAIKGASMVKYNLNIGDASPVSVNYSETESVITPTINNITSNIIKLNAEDSRKISKEVVKTLDNTKFKDYTNIQKGDINITRSGNVGTNVTLTYNGTLWGQSFGQVTNTAKRATYRFKKTSDSNWTTGTTTITPTTSGNNYSFSHTIAGDLGNTGFSAEYSFNIEVEVFDELSSTVFSFTLGTGIPWVAVADDGIAIKGPYDDNDNSVLQVNGGTNVKGDLVSTSFQGRPWNFNTDDTTNTWVPVAGGGEWKHRAIPAIYNSNHPAIKMETIDGRITNANIAHTYENNKAHLQLLIASASMTSNKPSADGFIVHCSWDNNGQYDGQLYLPNTSGNVPVQFRGCNNGTWGSWENIWRAKTLYSNDNGTNGTVTLSETCANFAFIDLTFRTNDGTNYIKTERIHMYNKTSGIYDLIYFANSGTGIWTKQKSIKINGTSITNVAYAQWAEYGSISPSYSNNYIYITRVVGYR